MASKFRHDRGYSLFDMQKDFAKLKKIHGVSEMTTKELAEKDLKKARLSLENARAQKNVEKGVISNLEKKCALREEIFKIVSSHTEVKQNA